jgi:quercetin dioxygenase-like cupin family protein
MRLPKTVFAGHERVLRQTVIAMANGQALEEHDSPGEATLHVLHGRVRLDAAGASWDGLTALEDAAVLLTVAKIG